MSSICLPCRIGQATETRMTLGMKPGIVIPRSLPQSDALSLSVFRLGLTFHSPEISISNDRDSGDGKTATRGEESGLFTCICGGGDFSCLMKGQKWRASGGTHEWRFCSMEKKQVDGGSGRNPFPGAMLMTLWFERINLQLRISECGKSPTTLTTVVNNFVSGGSARGRFVDLMTSMGGTLALAGLAACRWPRP